MSKYKKALENYIHQLRDTPIAFVYMSLGETKLKTSAKVFGPKHYITFSPNPHQFYLYVYKESDVKYFMTNYQDNLLPVRILNFKVANPKNRKEMEHKYTANHGDHLTFGIYHMIGHTRYAEIDVHRTVYIHTKHKSVSYFRRAPSKNCHFKFDSKIKTYEKMLQRFCLNESNPPTIDTTLDDPIDKQIVWHLFNKMNSVDVDFPIEVPPPTTGGRPFYKYKDYDFVNEYLLEFIRINLRKIQTINPNVNTNDLNITLCYDGNYANIICFLDFDSGRSRNVLIINIVKALKACYAFYNEDKASKREKKTLKTFDAQFQIILAKLLQN